MTRGGRRIEVRVGGVNAVDGVFVGLQSSPDHEELDIDTNTGTEVDAWICSASFNCARN